MKISDEELDFVGGKDNIHNIMKQYEISVVVITLGGDGAEVFYLENTADNGKKDFANGKVKSITVPAMKVKVVDTTGAGDCYCGALCVALSEGRNLTEAAEFATKAAAQSVRKAGAQNAMPFRNEVE